jgi:hypothetical protein
MSKAYIIKKRDNFPMLKVSIEKLLKYKGELKCKQSERKKRGSI